jgi:MbtH protein
MERRYGRCALSLQKRSLDCEKNSRRLALTAARASPDGLSHSRHIDGDPARAIPLATNRKPILNSEAFLTPFARCSPHRVRATLDARHSHRGTSFNANSRRLYFVAIRSTNEGSNSVDNPFDDEQGTFRVLINESRQRSLWPAHLDVPDGWKVEHPSSSRQQCLDYIEQNWIDPRS